MRRSAEYLGAMFHLVPVPSRGRALSLFVRDAGYFRSLVEELKPEIVHGWGTEDSCGLVARKLSPSRHVIGIQGLINAYLQRIRMHPRYQIIRFTEWLTLKKAKVIVGETAYSVQEAAKLCPGALSEVIDHPLRHEFLDSDTSDGSARTMLFLGEVSERKGITDALEAFSRAAPDDWRLKVIGKGSPAEEDGFRLRAAALGLESRLDHVRGMDAEALANEMRRASVFLLPTRIDTGPTALKEALTVGLWPICYDNSGPREYIRRFDFGSVAEDGNVNALGDILRRDIAERPWLERRRREKAAQEAKRHFSPARIWDQLLALYARVKAGSR